MKRVWIGLILAAFAAQDGASAQERKWLPAGTPAEAGQELLRLSRDRWLWMAERRMDALESLFHEEAFFVHVGAAMTRSQEPGVIRGGGIQYRQADLQEAAARILGRTGIVLNRIRLTAVVGGNEGVNPFMVTEVSVRQGNAWKLAVLSFTRLMGE
ncbi:MAG: nuclear transport factor 2 family protein [Bryobacteraceae bacterium]|nr:nuclear transport factor 2 family protein [Bryobacteraceae bacterium]